MTLERILRLALIVKGDANAVSKGRIGRRVARRVYGKGTGMIARKWFG